MNLLAPEFRRIWIGVIQQGSIAAILPRVSRKICCHECSVGPRLQEVACPFGGCRSCELHRNLRTHGDMHPGPAEGRDAHSFDQSCPRLPLLLIRHFLINSCYYHCRCGCCCLCCCCCRCCSCCRRHRGSCGGGGCGGAGAGSGGGSGFEWLKLFAMATCLRAFQG